MNLLLTLLIVSQAPQPGPLPADHPPVALPANTPSPAELVKQLDGSPGVKEKDKPFEICASLGRLYVGQGRTDQGRGYYEQAMKKAEPVRAYFTQQRRAAGARALPQPAAVGCAPGGGATMESLFERARSKAADPAVAAACAAAALAGTREVDVQLGNLLFVSGDAPAALAAFTRALETFADNTAARYARAALLLDTRGDDPASLKTVKADLDRVVKEGPAASPRTAQAQRLLDRASAALEKGGISKLPQLVAVAARPGATQAAQAPAPGSAPPPQLSPETVKAFEDAPRTPEMQQNFARLIDEAEDHLAHARFNEARASYLQVMPYEPNNPRLRAGMAWAMIRLNRQPMADNVWRAAVEAPDAVSALGDTLKAKGDAEGAKAVWQRLKETVPSYAPRLEGKL